MLSAGTRKTKKPKQEDHPIASSSIMSTNAAAPADMGAASQGSTAPRDEHKVGDYLTEDDFLTGTDKNLLDVILSLATGKLKQPTVRSQLGIDRLLKIDLDCFFQNGSKVPLSNAPTSQRLAPQDFGFDEALAHDLDVKELDHRLQELEAWHTDENIRRKYLAPILPIVQASGTGKSRLIHTLRCSERRTSNSRTILLTDESTKSTTGVKIGSFDEIHCVGPMTTDNQKRAQNVNLRTLVLKMCKDCIDTSMDMDNIDGVVPHLITLFFDEAQHLAPEEGYLIRVLRWITREKNLLVERNDEKVYLTVVLAGTNSSLANFFPETAPASTSSRHLTNDSDYHESGSISFPPFFILRTMGCLSQKMIARQDDEGLDSSTMVDETEYEQMIPYSRPLFAVLQKKNELNSMKEYEIARKVVLGEDSTGWHRLPRPCLSVLGTRIQMGPTSAPVVSELVAKGYAHLTFFQHASGHDSANRALFAFLPDPVCARVAMCLMDEEYVFQGMMYSGSSAKSPLPPTVRGAKKTLLVEMMGRIFADGICLPARGDFGEVAAALYLLLCGDVLRKRNGSNYHKLSVDYVQWMDALQNQGRIDGGEATPSGLTVNCIQFYRQSLRFALGEMAKGSFLKNLYRKGCAIYCANNVEAVDLVVPCHKVGTDHYFPVFVSVKNYGYMDPGKATKFLNSSWRSLDKAGIKHGLCLLLITGQDRQINKVSGESYKNETLRDINGGYASLVQALRDNQWTDIEKRLVPGFLCIHHDDFGIHKALLSGTTVKDEQKAEAFAAHSDLIHESFDEKDPSKVELGTQKYRREAKEFFGATVNCVQRYERANQP